MKKIRKNYLPSGKKMWKRAVFELMWGGPHRDYGDYFKDKKQINKKEKK